ncbi:MAG: VIT1/CCC1 transporter family protein [Candidatus Njordarchaeota archaeon]
MKMTININKVKEFWEDEIIASSIYRFMSKKSKRKKKEMFEKLASMEDSHADFWHNFALKYMGRRFKKSIRLRIKIFFYKLLAFFLPVTFMIYYLELGERSATLEYSIILENFEAMPEVYEQIKKIIYDEIEHEANFSEILIGSKSKIASIKDAIYGMTDSLVEILALVIGLAGITGNTLAIGLTGLIAAIGGTFSMTTGAYLSTKSQKDIYEGEISEIEAKANTAPDLLEKDLEVLLREKGLSDSVIQGIIGKMKDDIGALKNMVKHLKVEEEPPSPGSIAKVTGVYYVLGSLPAIIPFFVAYFLSISPIFAAIISILSASVTAFFAGIFTAVLSGTGIKKKAILNVLMIVGSAFATYTIGTLARILLGIEI